MKGYNLSVEAVNLKNSKYDTKWYKNEIRKNRNQYLKDIKSGKTDPGYVWAFMKLWTFLEGVFTLKVVPEGITLEIPAGELHLSKAGDYWVVRNDYNNTVGSIQIEKVFEWALEQYPNGIGAEGYEKLAMDILCLGCDDKQASEIYDKTFFVEKVA